MALIATMALGSLWLQVVLSAVAVFIVSSLVHMVIRYHNADYKPVPNEDAAMEGLRKIGLAPGYYMLPYCKPEDMKNPDKKAKWEKGPVGVLMIAQNGMPNMGKMLGMWFGLTLLISFCVAYVARHTLAPGADAMTVMRLTGSVTFIAYGLSPIADSIWMSQPWSNTIRFMIDALLYALATGAVFALMWPAAQ